MPDSATLTRPASIVVAALALLTASGLTPHAGATVGAQGASEMQAAEPAGGQFGGTWWMNFGPPPQRPLILTLTDRGAFLLEDSLDGGGHLPTGASFSVTQGSWARTGGPSARALGLRFVYDASGKTAYIERVRLSLSFAGSFERLEGMIQLEAMSCAELPSPLGFNNHPQLRLLEYARHEHILSPGALRKLGGRVYRPGGLSSGSSAISGRTDWLPDPAVALSAARLSRLADPIPGAGASGANPSTRPPSLSR